MSSILLTSMGRCATMALSRSEGPIVPTEPNHRFANFINSRMDVIDLAPIDLTTRFGIPVATVSRWRAGDLGENPELKNFVAFSEALESPLWEVLEQAGYPIERPTDPAETDRQLARQIEATPELRPIVQWLFDLDLDDRLAVMTFVEVLRRRRAEQAQKSNRPRGRRRKADQGET